MKNANKDLLYDLESPYTASSSYMESERRDIYYSALVKDIVKNNRTSQKLKVIFFIIVCIVFCFICVCGMFIIMNSSNKESITNSDIGIAITGFGSVLSTVIVLPKIIAKHLFPENSEKDRFAFMKQNQQLDQEYLEFYESGAEGINVRDNNEETDQTEENEE